MSDGCTPSIIEAEMIDEAYVIAAAKALDLPIAPEHLPGVVANLQRIAAIYEPLDALALGPEDEAAPVWIP
jgi:hypothetical protein